jgi:hypothetical protein
MMTFTHSLDKKNKATSKLDVVTSWKSTTERRYKSNIKIDFKEIIVMQLGFNWHRIKFSDILYYPCVPSGFV